MVIQKNKECFSLHWILSSTSLLVYFEETFAHGPIFVSWEHLIPCGPSERPSQKFLGVLLLKDLLLVTPVSY